MYTSFTIGMPFTEAFLLLFLKNDCFDVFYLHHCPSVPQIFDLKSALKIFLRFFHGKKKIYNWGIMHGFYFHYFQNQIIQSKNIRTFKPAMTNKPKNINSIKIEQISINKVHTIFQAKKCDEELKKKQRLSMSKNQPVSSYILCSHLSDSAPKKSSFSIKVHTRVEVAFLLNTSVFDLQRPKVTPSISVLDILHFLSLKIRLNEGTTREHECAFFDVPGTVICVS